MDIDIKAACADVDALLDQAQVEPVKIQENGKTLAVMVSAETYHHYLALLNQNLRVELQEGLADLEAGRTLDGHTVFSELLRS